jgi:Galactosyltransferase
MSDARLEQDYILLVMNCVRYREKALVQKAGWLQNIPVCLSYYHVIGDPDLSVPYLFDNEERILWVKTLDDYNSLPKKVISALHAVRTTFKFKYVFKTDDDQILQDSGFFDMLIDKLVRKPTKMKAHYGGQVVDVQLPYLSQYFHIHPELPQDMIIQKTEYCSGRFYFLSPESVTNLVSKRENIEKEYLEDYAIGLNLNPIFKKVMIHLQSDEYFKDMELNTIMS